MALQRYIIGFALSVIFTLSAFGLVALHIYSGHLYPTHAFLYAALPTLGVLQFFVQIMFFLHLGDEKRPRWNLLMFALATVVVIILVGGSLWIMYNLSLNHIHTQSPYSSDVITPQSEND